MGLISISLKTGVKKFDELVLKEVKQIISVIKTLKFHLFLFERFIDLQSVPPKNNQKLKNETFYFRSASQYDIKLSNCLSEG